MQPSAAGAGTLATDDKDRRNTMVRTLRLCYSNTRNEAVILCDRRWI